MPDAKRLSESRLAEFEFDAGVLVGELTRKLETAVRALRAAGCMRVQIGRPRCGTERPKLRDAAFPPDGLCMVCAALAEIQPTEKR